MLTYDQSKLSLIDNIINPTLHSLDPIHDQSNPSFTKSHPRHIPRPDPLSLELWSTPNWQSSKCQFINQAQGLCKGWDCSLVGLTGLELFYKDVIGSPNVRFKPNLDYMLGHRPVYDELTGPGPNSNPFLYYINILSITICFYNCTIFIHILSISPGKQVFGYGPGPDQKPIIN